MARVMLALSFCGLLAAASASDLERRVIPNRLLALGAAVAMAIAAADEPATLPERLAAAAAAGAPLLALAFVYPRGLGMGDAKLVAVMGLYLGRAVAPALLVGFGAGALGGALLVARNGASARKRAIPFAPFLAFGGVVGLLAGDAIVGWYATSFTPAR
jgi:leader peptidase (prepilin peptidase) / N-methyltransferase